MFLKSITVPGWIIIKIHIRERDSSPPSLHPKTWQSSFPFPAFQCRHNWKWLHQTILVKWSLFHQKFSLREETTACLLIVKLGAQKNWTLLRWQSGLALPLNNVKIFMQAWVRVYTWLRVRYPPLSALSFKTLRRLCDSRGSRASFHTWHFS